MGVAAWNRGTAVVRRQIEADKRPVEFEIMEDLSNLPKFDYAKQPFSDIVFVAGHGGWWAECPTTGRGYWYKTLREAVRSWRVAIVGFVDETWQATPC